MKIRVGVEGGRRPVLAKVKEIGAPILVSANSLWRNKTQRFTGFDCYLGHDVALDSGGFIAMKLYGGYRWTIDQYVDLAKRLKPAWWAQMDFCCEPQIAADAGQVSKRIDRTVDHLLACEAQARHSGVPAPMPVLQGWKPKDYCSGPIYERNGDQWPDLVGIGSVCRRNVRGSDGILAVVNALDQIVPPHVKFHLFGVKSTAMVELMASFSHRIASVDSMAWNFACRIDARQRNVRCDGIMRAEAMADWYNKQLASVNNDRQLPLWQ